MSVAGLYRNRGVNASAVSLQFDFTTNLQPTGGFSADFEVDTNGWGGGSTISRTTTNPIAGTASLKAVSVNADNLYANTEKALVIGKTYLWMGVVRTYATAGVLARAFIGTGGSATGPWIDCSVSAQTLWIVFTASAAMSYPVFMLDAYNAGDFFLLDTVKLYKQI